MSEELKDDFHGDDTRLVACIEALVAMNDKGALSAPIGSHARELLAAAAVRLSRPAPASAPAQVPEGWMVVPIEPTQEMLLKSGLYDNDTIEVNSAKSLAGQIYRAMIAAAPSAPAARESGAQDTRRYTMTTVAGIPCYCVPCDEFDAMMSVPQGGGVDAENLELAADLLQECIVQNGGQPSEMAIDWVRKIGALLASPAGQHATKEKPE